MPESGCPLGEGGVGCSAAGEAQLPSLQLGQTLRTPDSPKDGLSLGLPENAPLFGLSLFPNVLPTCLC